MARIFVQTIYPKGLTILFHLCAVHKNLINWKEINYNEIFKFLFDCVYPKNPESFYINVSLLAKQLEEKGLIKNYKPIGFEKSLFVLKKYTFEMTKCLVLLFEYNANTDQWFIKTENDAPCMNLGQVLSTLNNLKYYWNGNGYTLCFNKTKLQENNSNSSTNLTVDKINFNHNVKNDVVKEKSFLSKIKYYYASSASNKAGNERCNNKRKNMYEKFEKISYSYAYGSDHKVANKSFSEINPYSILKKYKMQSDVESKDDGPKNALYRHTKENIINVSNFFSEINPYLMPKKYKMHSDIKNEDDGLKNAFYGHKKESNINASNFFQNPVPSISNNYLVDLSYHPNPQNSLFSKTKM